MTDEPIQSEEQSACYICQRPGRLVSIYGSEPGYLCELCEHNERAWHLRYWVPLLARDVLHLPWSVLTLVALTALYGLGLAYMPVVWLGPAYHAASLVIIPVILWETIWKGRYPG